MTTSNAPLMDCSPGGIAARRRRHARAARTPQAAAAVRLLLALRASRDALDDLRAFDYDGFPPGLLDSFSPLSPAGRRGWEQLLQGVGWTLAQLTQRLAIELDTPAGQLALDQASEDGKQG